MFSKMLFGVYLSRLVPIPHPIYVLFDTHFADTRSYSPTSLAYESIIHRSTTSNTHTIYCENGHAPICAYCHFRFPFVNLAHITSRFLIAFQRIPMPP